MYCVLNKLEKILHIRKRMMLLSFPGGKHRSGLTGKKQFKKNLANPLSIFLS